MTSKGKLPKDITTGDKGKLFIHFIFYLLSSYSTRLCAACVQSWNSNFEGLLLSRSPYLWNFKPSPTVGMWARENSFCKHTIDCSILWNYSLRTGSQRERKKKNSERETEDFGKRSDRGGSLRSGPPGAFSEAIRCSSSVRTTSPCFVYFSYLLSPQRMRGQNAEKGLRTGTLATQASKESTPYLFRFRLRLRFLSFLSVLLL